MSNGAKRWLGIAAVVQGALLVYISEVATGAALRVAEILYAEGFDRAAIVPEWFGVWSLVMRHRDFLALVYLISGAPLVIAGLFFLRRGLDAQPWFERALLLGIVCCLIVGVALIPLRDAGSEWIRGTPGYDVRREVVGSTAAVWLECVMLLATFVIVRRMRG
jgi:hypothetical protein